MSYEEFRATAEWEPRLGGWVVEGDVLLRDEDELRAYYDRAYAPTGALTVSLVAGADDIWDRTNRLNLTYCVSQADFGANYNAAVAALQQAAGAWENVANVHFVHVSSLDTNCSNTTTSVVFDVRPWNGSTGFAFYPSWSRDRRTLWTNWAASPWWPSDQQDLIGVLMHELGHVLGFQHEHARYPGTQCTEVNWRGVNAYDTLSIMHAMQGAHFPPPPNPCPGSTNNTLYPIISQRDVEGAQLLYEAPTNVVDAADGTVYARKRSDGRFFKKESTGSWTSISSPAQAFVTVGNTLYKVVNNVLQVYSGSGSSWTTVSGAGTVWQIFKCGIYLCTTVSDGSIRRYLSGTWTTIGGAGARFISTGGGTVYGLDPLETQVYKYSGSGTSWSNVGGRGYWEIFANNSSVYGLVKGRQNVDRYSGSGAVWNQIGGTGRQWLGISTSLYALTSDGGGVWRFASGTWSSVGGAAARLYGLNNTLYATGPNTADIYALNGSTWSSVGKP